MRGALLFSLLLASPQSAPSPRAIADAGNALDVAYLGTGRDVLHAGEHGPERQARMNVHWPDDGKVHPALIFVHGGGWIAGHKDLDFPKGIDPKLVEQAVREGFVAVNLNYLLGEDIHPQVLWDFKAAVRFLRKNAARFRIDPARIGAWGFSTGGSLVSSGSWSDASSLLVDLKNAAPAGAARLKAEQRLLVPMDDPRSEHADHSSRLQAIAVDLFSHPRLLSSDDPATLTYVAAGEPSPLSYYTGNAAVDYQAVELKGPQFEDKHEIEMPDLRHKVPNYEGTAEIELKDRVFQFFKRYLGPEGRAPAPEFRPNRRVFRDRLQIEIVVPPGDYAVHFTTDGSAPWAESAAYAGPFEVTETTTVRAVTVPKKGKSSGFAEAVFTKGEPPPSIAGPDALPKGKVGRPYSVAFSRIGEKPGVWNVALQGRPSRPLGLAIDKAAGVLQGTPAHAGAFLLQVHAGWEFGGPAEVRSYILEIEP